MFNVTKLTCVSLATRPSRAGGSERTASSIFPTNEAWPNRRLTAENEGSE